MSKQKKINIENKATSIEKEDNTFVTYADLLSVVINTPIIGGYTIEDMKLRISIIEACKDENVKGIIEVTPEELSFIKSILNPKTYKWAVIHKDIIEFSDYIQNIK